MSGTRYTSPETLHALAESIQLRHQAKALYAEADMVEDAGGYHRASDLREEATTLTDLAAVLWDSVPHGI